MRKEGYTRNPRISAFKCDRDCIIGEYLKDCTYLKSVVDDLVAKFDEIADTPETTSIKSVDKNGYYRPYTILLAVTCLLLILAIILFYWHMQRLATY